MFNERIIDNAKIIVENKRNGEGAFIQPSPQEKDKREHYRIALIPSLLSDCFPDILLEKLFEIHGALLGYKLTYSQLPAS